MTTYFAFLRAINLGKRIVKSGELKKIFEDLGFENVRTYIASGNVIFESKEKDEGKLTQKIEKHLKDTLGYEVKTMLRSQAELEAVLKNNPFKKALEGATGYISFLSEKPQKAAAKEIEERSSDTEIFKFKNRELYMLFHVRMSDSEFFKKPNYEKVLGVAATNRNLNTPAKMLALIKKD